MHGTFSASSDVSTTRLNTQVLASAWRSANGSYSDTADRFGWSLSPDEDPHSSLRSRTEPAKVETSRSHGSILLVEDNAGDVGLVKEALTENGLQVQLYVISDGEKAVEFIDEIDSA